MTKAVSTPHGAALRAKELYKLGFAKGAIDVLEVALRDEPLQGGLWRLRAVLLAREGRHDEAFANVQEALTLAPLGHEELLILAGGYARRSHAASAGDIYSQLAADPEFPLRLWPSIYSGFCAIGRWHTALIWLRRVARKLGDDDRVYFAMAQAMGCLGRPAELVLNVLHKAIHLNPGEPRYRLTLAIYLARVGRSGEGYRELAALGVEAIGSVDCRCCMQKCLQLCIEHGDGSRAAAFAARLAALVKAGQTSSQEGVS